LLRSGGNASRSACGSVKAPMYARMENGLWRWGGSGDGAGGPGRSRNGSSTPAVVRGAEAATLTKPCTNTSRVDPHSTETEPPHAVLESKVEELQLILRDFLKAQVQNDELAIEQAKLQLEMPSDHELEWFLLDSDLDVNAAAQKLQAACQWRAQLRSACPQHVAAQRAAEKAFIHSHPDADGRKVLVIRAGRHTKPSSQDEILAAQHLMQQLLDGAVAELEAERRLGSASSECMLGIMDLRGFGLSNADPNLAEFFADCFFKYYPKRINEMLLIDVPLMFRPTLQHLVKPVLGKYSSIVRSISAKQVADYFPAATPLPSGFPMRR